MACSSDDDSTDNLQVQQDIIPEACFEITDTNYLTLSFNSDCSENAADYEWDFGDGETTINQNPTHTYEEDGYYTITLRVTSNTGNTDRTESGLSVSEEQVCTECTCEEMGAPMVSHYFGTEAEVSVYEATFSTQMCIDGTSLGCERFSEY